MAGVRWLAALKYFKAIHSGRTSFYSTSIFTRTMAPDLERVIRLAGRGSWRSSSSNPANRAKNDAFARRGDTRGNACGRSGNIADDAGAGRAAARFAL